MCVDRGTSTTVTNTVDTFYFPLSFQSYRSIISSPSTFTWIYSKLNHISDPPSTFLIHAANMQLRYN